MVTKIRQGDPRWSDVLLGPSNATVGRYGCTTASMCMALEKLRGYFCNPGEAARWWTYNARGEILWHQTDWKGMKFVKRGWGNNVSEISSYANGDKTAAILSVNGNSHWLYVNRASNGEYSVIDPIDGKLYDKLPSKYKVHGYALFEKEEIISDWAKDAVAWCVAQGICNEDGIREPVTKEQVCTMIYRAHKK